MVDELAVERDAIADEARRYAGHYPEASDGRNTFIIFADLVEARGAKEKR
jgi:predicted SnoaL-like aldol condensation-catalyzing enzyme